MLLNILIDIKRSKMFLVAVSTCALLAHFPVFISDCLAQEASADLGVTVTINAKNTPIKDVLVEFSKQTNWHVLFDAAIEKEHVSGSFSQEPLDSFLNKILKGKNLIVLYDAKQKIVDIQSFGDKRPRAFLISKGQLRESPLSTGEQELFISHANGLSQLAANKDELTMQEPLSGAQLGAITALQQQQKQAYEEYLNNPDSVEPLTGIRLGAIAELQNQQKQAYEEYLNNPESVEPVTGVKLGVIAELQKQQKKAYTDNASNPAVIDPLTGMTQGAIAERQNQQLKAYDKRQALPGFSGM